MTRIYLDHAAAVPVDPRVIEFAQPFLSQIIGNPSSLHSVGLVARQALEEARQKIARFVNAEDEQTILFTSGATEANNLGIRGMVLRNKTKGTTVAVSAIEHMSVLNPVKDLTKQGFTMVSLPVDSTGCVNQEDLSRLVTKDTILTSIQYANNEIGTIQPIRELSKIIHDQGSYLHVDATAAAAWISIDVQRDGIDLLTLSSNDLAGPQGAGVLYVKPGIKLQPIIFGGGQEKGLRSGTENLFAIVGMGEAARFIQQEQRQERHRLQPMRDTLIKEILTIDHSFLTGHPQHRLPHHASFRFSGIEGESILLNMDMEGIQVSTGSACSSKTLEPSHVLLAIGLKHEEAHGSMVLTLGRSTTPDQIPQIIQATKKTVARLRALSPLPM
ncbi:MAG: cysteine desulfurase family protein [Candidatus Thermoplasmatota archaeon]